MVGFSPILLAFVIGLVPVLAYILLIKSFQRRHEKPAAAKKLPPGSMGWPVFGETLHFLKPHYSNSPGTFLQQHCSRWSSTSFTFDYVLYILTYVNCVNYPVRYGKVFKSHLFGSRTIVSCDLELNMFILQNEEKLFQASYPKPIHGILGKYSLLTVSGDLHRKLRNVGVSFIASSKSSPHFLHWVETLSIMMMDSWSGRKQVSFFKEAKAVRTLIYPLATLILQHFYVNSF